MLQRLFFTLLLLCLFLGCPIVSHSIQTSDKELAITVIDALIQSLKYHPDQFTCKTNIVGVNASIDGKGKGVALNINVKGEGQNSPTS